MNFITNKYGPKINKQNGHKRQYNLNEGKNL